MDNPSLINYQQKQTIDILIQLMINKKFCPSNTYPFLNENLIIKLARRNKIDEYLSHFINCSYCQKKRSKKFISKINNQNKKRIFQILSYKKELAKFNKIKKKNNLPAIAYKKNSTNIRSSSDIDILVFKKDLPKFIKEYKKIGYKISKVICKKEVHLINPNNNFAIDLHFLIAYPHFFSLSKKDLDMVKKISRQMLTLQSPNKIKPSLDKELVLTSLLIRYWHNDLSCGLKTFYEIMLMLKSFQSSKEISKLIKLLKKYEFLNLSLFTFLIGSKIFSIPIPQKIKLHIPLLIKLLVNSISKYKISIFPNINSWHHSQNISWAINYNNHLNFIKLIVDDKTNFWRKIRPKIILFITYNVFLTIINNFFNFRRKPKNKSNLIGN